MTGGRRGSYLGAGSIVRTHPVGFGKRKLRINGAIVWTNVEEEIERGEAKLFVPKEVIRPGQEKQFANKLSKTEGSNFLLGRDVDQKNKLLLGFNQKGFSEFVRETNELLEKSNCKSRRSFDAASAAMLNKQGWKTLTGNLWNTKLVETFFLFFSDSSKRKHMKTVKRIRRMKIRQQKSK